MMSVPGILKGIQVQLRNIFKNLAAYTTCFKIELLLCCYPCGNMHIQNTKPVQNCTGFLFCTFSCGCTFLSNEGKNWYHIKLDFYK